jgi:PKD repeat protein
MLKLYFSLFLFFSISLKLANAQTVVVFENFSTYDGTATTVPAQWIFSNQGIYTDSNYCGITGPNAYQFNMDQSYILTPFIEPSDSLLFWLKDSSATTSLSNLIVFSTTDSVKWDTLVKITSLPIAGTKYAYKIASTIKQFKFVFYKNSPDNLAFDDFYIKQKTTATADFYAKSACYGDSTFFLDWSTNLINGGATLKWLWNFGDGKVDTTQNPIHLYATAGTYSVKLKIKNTKGDIDSITKFYIVFPRPNENFITGPSGPCSNRCIQFTDKSTITGGGVDEDKAAIVTWEWDIAGTSFNIPSPLQCFKTPGNYIVSLIAIADNGCAGHKEIKTIVIPAGIQTAFSYVNSSKSTYDFSGTVSGETPPITYKWLFGDGDSSSLQSATHSFIPNYDYTVCLTASGSGGSCDMQCEIIKVAAPLGMPESLDEKSFALYPNPSNGQVYLNTNETGLLTVYTILGKIQLQKNISAYHTELDISNLDPGNYVVQYKTHSSSIFKKISILY